MLSSPVLNPFMLLMDPSLVLKAMESSSSLCSLRARVLRPLEPDAGARGLSDEVAAYDAAIEFDLETEAGIEESGIDAARP
jgi:hypothetical protein